MTQAATYDAILGTGNNIRQVVSTEYAPGNRIEPGRVSAGVDPSALFVTDANPQIRLSSTDIAAVLGIVSPTVGLDIDDDLWTIPYNVRAIGSTFASTLAHTVLTGADAFVVPRQVSVTQGGNAQIDLMVMIESNDLLGNPGFDAPVTAATGQTLAAQAFNALWTQGPATVNGSDVGGVVGMTVDFGIQAVPLDKADGELYPKAHSIRARNPSITIDVVNVDALATFAEHLLPMTAFVGYLRKRSPGGSFVADATGEHISFTFADGIVDVQRVSARDNATARPGLRLIGEALTVSTTATLP